jgi:hypothetical protein
LFHETNPGRTDLEAGQYDNPNRGVAFNTAERWANDVSEHSELSRRPGKSTGAARI